MTTNNQSIFKDSTIKQGLIFLVASILVFLTSLLKNDLNYESEFPLFLIHYILTWIYFLVVIFRSKKDTDRYFRFPNFAHNVILLQLFNISAYSLNRIVSVFNLSTNWMVGLLVLTNGLLLFHVLNKNYRLNWMNHLVLGVSTIGLFFHIYQTLYIGPLYLYGVMGFWLFGIPLHVFVPILFVWTFCKVIRQYLKASPVFYKTMALSTAFLLLFVGYFSFRYHQVNKILANSFHQNHLPFEDSALPAWVKSSQQLNPNWITERALKAGIVYRSFNKYWRNFGDMNFGSFQEKKKHDPLVMIASAFSSAEYIPSKDRIKILEFMFDERHKTERKLWSSADLATTDIVTNVQLFPKYRLAYTEKLFKIRNNSERSWTGQQEALYSFYLPEGSVVTSAALWVEGEESLAFLTTKTKADSAYTRIVGRERRDPLLLHWQEGNRVTVRVFPCTPQEDRQFKIGVTTPLRNESGQLIYENIDFKGPDWEDAVESINVVTEGELANIDAPFLFKEQGTAYQYSGKYNSNWHLSFDAPDLSSTPFFFNEKSFHLEAMEQKFQSFTPDNYYIDINRGWSKNEFSTIWNLIKEKNVYVYINGRIEQITSSNHLKIFKQLRKRNYSLFPFQKIVNGSEALVVSKFSALTPTIKDFKKSTFNEQLSQFFQENTRPVRVFNIGNSISPYLQNLKEMRTIQLETGSLNKIEQLLSQNKFYEYQEDEKVIVNNYAGFKLVETKDVSSQKSQAPDHLMRLFAYNNLLKAVGENFVSKKELAKELIDEAKEAHVVSPISSLIVLETQADYDRFDIKKSKNSLDNASIKNAGAVPEPHEWLLIFMALTWLTYLYRKQLFIRLQR